MLILFRLNLIVVEIAFAVVNSHDVEGEKFYQMASTYLQLITTILLNLVDFTDLVFASVSNPRKIIRGVCYLFAILLQLSGFFWYKCHRDPSVFVFYQIVSFFINNNSCNIPHL